VLRLGWLARGVIHGQQMQIISISKWKILSLFPKNVSLTLSL
jgi:hypothetical protein